MKKRFRKGDVVIVDVDTWHFLGVIFCWCHHVNYYFIENDYDEKDDVATVYLYEPETVTKIEGRL